MEEEKNLLPPVVWNRLEKIARKVNYLLMLKEIAHLFGGARAQEKRDAINKTIGEIKEETKKL